MYSMTDSDAPCCSQDLPVELRSLPPSAQRIEGKTARIVSGMTVSEPDDEVISRDLLYRQLLLPASTRTINMQGFGTH